MKQAWEFFTLALKSAWYDYSAFFKIWFSTLLILWLIGVLCGYALSDGVSSLLVLSLSEEIAIIKDASLGLSVLIVIYWVFSGAVVSGLSINTYRFYLAKSYTPSWVPFQIDWRTSFTYFGWSVLISVMIGLLTLIPAFLLLKLASWAAASEAGNWAWILLNLGLLFVAFLMAWCYLRFYNKLVAIAMGDRLSFAEAWRGTKGSIGFFFVLAMLTGMFYVVFILLSRFVSKLILGLIYMSPVLGNLFFFLAQIVLLLIVIYLAGFLFSMSSEIYRKYFINKDMNKKTKP